MPTRHGGNFSKNANRSTLQLTADYHLTDGINAVNLKNRLRDVESDCRDRFHG